MEAREIFDPSVRSQNPAALELADGAPREYKKESASAYDCAVTMTSSLIDKGKLPEEYGITPLPELREKITALASVYEAFENKGWEPEVVFVPRGLDKVQWNNVLAGHAIFSRRIKGAQLGAPFNTERQSKGVQDWKEHSRGLLVPSSQFDPSDTGLWDVAVVSATSRPALVNVNPAGTVGAGLESAIEKLSSLPVVPKESGNEGIITSWSPSKDVYFALQLARLVKCGIPVDDGRTLTIGKENVDDRGMRKSLFFTWIASDRKVISDDNSIRQHGDHVGVRPARAAQDLAKIATLL